MTERGKVEERLRRKEAEIQGLEEKLRSARGYAQALRDVLKMLDSVPASGAPATPVESVLRPGSAVAQARDVILKVGTPMHLSDLLAAQGKKPTRENRASLTSSLSAYVRRGEIFTRPAPNTFGLVELDHRDGASQAREPPRGFGRIPEQSKRADAEAADDDLPFRR